MPISQNVRFSGSAVADEEFDHPEGASIARLLQAGLSKRDWIAKPIDNWRDCGWEIDCDREEWELQVVVASVCLASEWMTQVAARYHPGIIGRLLGKRPSADPKTILALARDVGIILSESGQFTDFKWCWDGYPKDFGASPIPEEPA